MAEQGPNKGSIGFGIFLVVGAIGTSILKVAGFMGPISNTGYSQGSVIGYVIGSAVTAVIGIAMIVKGLNQNKDS